ncbi:MAG: GNAT family N-acetyltransferase [Halobacteriales archaeon]
MPGPVFMSGEQVSLHTVEEADLDAFVRARSDPEVRIPLGVDTPGNRDTLETYHEETISGGDGYWFVAVADDELVGAAMFPTVDASAGRGECSSWVLPEHRGEGYRREALALLLEYGFDELRLHRVRWDGLATDEDSRELHESLGFTEEGRFRDAAFQGGEHVDVLRYGLLAAEWRAG